MADSKKTYPDSSKKVSLLKAIEKSFSIRLRSGETKNIHNFGELTDLVIAKINLRKQESSGQLHAFEILRNAIATTQRIDKEEIRQDTKLVSLFPRKFRRTAIRELEYELGTDLQVLRPYLLIEAIFFFVLIGTIITLFFDFMNGIKALALLILLINLAFRTGKEFNRGTVGDLAEKIVNGKTKKIAKLDSQMSEEEIMEKMKVVFREIYPEEENISRENML
jgi:hypothetical protein